MKFLSLTFAIFTCLHSFLIAGNVQRRFVLTKVILWLTRYFLDPHPFYFLNKYEKLTYDNRHINSIHQRIRRSTGDDAYVFLKFRSHGRYRVRILLKMFEAKYWPKLLFYIFESIKNLLATLLPKLTFWQCIILKQMKFWSELFSICCQNIPSF